MFLYLSMGVVLAMAVTSLLVVAALIVWPGALLVALVANEGLALTPQTPLCILGKAGKVVSLLLVSLALSLSLSCWERARVGYSQGSW